jgi:hypothetical protein
LIILYKMNKKIHISVKRGGLSGYSIHDLRKDRRKVLVKIAKRDTFGKVIRRLNVLYIFNKNRNIILADKFKRDLKYIEKLYKEKKKQKVEYIKSKYPW